MSTKFSIVTSVADGCGNRRPFGQWTVRFARTARRKNPNMCTKAWSTSHGSFWTTATIVAGAVVATSIGALGFGSGVRADTTYIYNDPLTEYSSATPGQAPAVALNGEVPGSVAGTGNGNAWIAPNGTTPTLATNSSGAYLTTTSSGAYAATQQSGPGNAFLPFTPSTGYIYTLQATFTLGPDSPTWDSIVGGANNVWDALGFTSGVGTTSWWWQLPVRDDANMRAMTTGGTDEAFATTNVGSSGKGIDSASAGSVDPITMAITLTTNPTLPWTVGFSFVDTKNPSNSSVVGPLEFPTPPTITDVGFGQNNVESFTVSNFSLSQAPIPEPTTLALLALSGFGLLLLTRRRTV